jgi:hypothetical protein
MLCLLFSYNDVMLFAQAIVNMLFLCGIWAEKTDTRSRANEGGNMYRESDVGHKNDKARHGDE